MFNGRKPLQSIRLCFQENTFLDNDRMSEKRLLGKFLIIDRMVQQKLGFNLTIKSLRSLLLKV